MQDVSPCLGIYICIYMQNENHFYYQLYYAINLFMLYRIIPGRQFQSDITWRAVWRHFSGIYQTPEVNKRNLNIPASLAVSSFPTWKPGVHSL